MTSFDIGIRFLLLIKYAKNGPDTLGYMHLLIIGTESNLEECKLKFGDKHIYQLANDHQTGERFFTSNDLIFDFIIDQFPEQMEVYRDHPQAIAFLSTPKTSLINLVSGFKDPIDCRLFGFNGLPTFLNREILEVSVLRTHDKGELTKSCEALGSKFLIVDDRVGMVTPRVIFMIINEAYYTVQEGTASREDINLGMKLGTNYPYGPFEWCERVGINHVYEVLRAVYADTGDERYKICPLLKHEYLLAMTARRKPLD